MRKSIVLVIIVLLSSIFCGKAICFSDGTEKIPETNVKFNVSDTTTLHAKPSKLYQAAYNEIRQMLRGQKPMSFKRAVFLTENAYYDGKLDWKEFCSQIEGISAKLKQMIVDKNMQSYKTKGNWAIYLYMTDSIPENNFHPYTYDFNDILGDRDMESATVTHLLKTRKGNCHALPFLYKILAEAIDAKAFIAMAPYHLYIRHKNEDDEWWNLELTSGSFARTSYMMETFKISDEGIESGLYMKALSEMESLALCLNDLISYLSKRKEYYPDFVRKVYTEGLKFYPNSGLLTSKETCEKYILDIEMMKKGVSDYKKIKQYPDLAKLHDKLMATKKYKRKIGFTRLTPEQYENTTTEMRNKSAQPKTE